MKKKLGKKFDLKRETLRNLDRSEEMAQVAGGLTLRRCHSISAYTCICATNVTDWTCNTCTTC